MLFRSRGTGTRGGGCFHMYVCIWWCQALVPAHRIFRCRKQAHELSWPMSCGILALQPRVEPTFSALENRLLITGPQGSPLNTRALTPCMGLSWWLSGKELACQCRRHQFDPWVRKIPWRRNILAWRIPWTEKPGGEQSRGSQKSQTGLSN